MSCLRVVTVCVLQVRDDYEEPAYGMIDTLFSLAEAYLFMQLVELVVSAVHTISMHEPASCC
jgi:hypothetical protein